MQERAESIWIDRGCHERMSEWKVLEGWIIWDKREDGIGFTELLGNTYVISLKLDDDLCIWKNEGKRDKSRVCKVGEESWSIRQMHSGMRDELEHQRKEFEEKNVEREKKMRYISVSVEMSHHIQTKHIYRPADDQLC